MTHRILARALVTAGVLSLTAALAWLAPAARSQPLLLTPENLRVEYLDRPLAVNEPHPRLSWHLTSGSRGEQQTAYQILVASTPEALARDNGDLWDSGRVTADSTSHVEYMGRPLQAGMTCHWKVRSWDADGVTGWWSRPSTWEVGLSAKDWTAEWIDATPAPVAVEVRRAIYQTLDAQVQRDVTRTVADRIADGTGDGLTVTNDTLRGDPAFGVAKELVLDYVVAGAALRARYPEGAPLVLPDASLPALRKTFTIDKPVRRARLHATALGVYELYLNGARVGDQHLAPGWTDYRRRVRTQTYDVTGSLTTGDNVLGAVVAPGWFCGHAGLFNAHRFYGDNPALLTQLEIEFTDGSATRIISDRSWKQAPSGTLQADLLKGETHDARAEAGLLGWNRPGFDDSAWTLVTVRRESRNLEPDVCEPVRVVAQVPATSLSEPAPGRWTFDLGQNIVGVVRLRLRDTAPGTVVTVRHAEILDADGTIYTKNLRGATSTDTYITRGGEVEEWTPRFTFHGFRYVEISGITVRPALDAVTGMALASDLEVAGSFECSDAALNQLQSNIVWGLRGNYLSVPTDCPQRDERMGWMADAQVFLPTATCNADVAAFMTKWTCDIMDAQREDGAHSDVAPVMTGLSYGTPAWGDAGVIVPWVLYQTYGDRRILERSVESMIRWVEWCREHSTGLIRDRDRGNDYGDWLSVKADTPKDLLGTAYFAHSARIVGETLRVLGRESEAAKYEQLFRDIKGAFIERYVGDDSRILGDTQTGYAVALRFDLMPDDLRATAAERLVADIHAKGDHLSTGFVGVSHLLPVLEQAGSADVAIRLLHQDTFPSWLFSVRHGATTIWERWDGWTPDAGPHPDWTMNSFNHYSLGSCGQWLVEGLGGIACDPATPGFARAIIRPHIDPSLSFAVARRRTMRGEFTSSWRIEGDTLLIDVSIPTNAHATVFVPAPSADDVLESGRPAASSPGVRLLRADPGAAVFEVDSGAYHFTSPKP